MTNTNSAITDLVDMWSMKFIMLMACCGSLVAFIVAGLGSFQHIKWDREGTKQIVIYTSTSGIHYCGLHELYSKVCLYVSVHH